MVKTLNPAAIEGEHSIEGVHQGRVRFDLLDVPDAAARVRLSSTVVSVKHDGDPKTADSLSVTYFRAGKLHRVKARSAVIAGGSWTAKHIVEICPLSTQMPTHSFIARLVSWPMWPCVIGAF